MAITLEIIWDGLQRLDTKVEKIDAKVGELDTKVGQLDMKIDRVEKKVDDFAVSINTEIENLAASVKEGFDDMDRQFQSFKKDYFPEQRVIHARLERLEARVGI